METTPPKVSVIIPVYNTEGYVADAIDSIRRQTLRELEIVTVDDGSTDGSPAILRRIGREEPRMRIHTQANGGQSAARNAGLRMAKGEFVYFFDSDDLLQADALRRCYETAMRDGSDVVCFDGLFVTERQAAMDTPITYQKKRALRATDASTPEGTGLPGPDMLQRLMRQRCFSASPCLNLIRTDYLRRIGLRFRPGIIHEDQLFTFLLYLQAERVSFVPEDFFLRRMRTNSTMTSPVSMRNIDGYLTVCKELKSFCAAETLSSLQRALLRRHIRTLVNVSASTALPLSFAERMRVLRKLCTGFPQAMRLPSALLLLFPCLKLKKKKNR